MLCRIALGFGYPPSVVAGWSASDIDLLARHFKEEPYGPMRDNFHAALITAKVHNMLRGKSKAVKVEDFMLVDKEAHSKRSVGGLVNFFKTIGKRKSG